MSLEKVAKEVKSSLNSISSLYLLLSSISDVAKQHKNSNTFSFHSALSTLRDVFLYEKEVEPTIRNLFWYIFDNDKLNNVSPQEVLGRISIIKEYIKNSQKKIARLGCNKVVDGGSVFVFGQDTFLLDTLKYARSSGKKFEVNNTEMRPWFYGRKLAGELSKGGINVTHYTDASLKKAMGGVDVVFSDCVAVLTNGNIIGTSGFELVADTALKLGIPLYVFAPSWKVNTYTTGINDFGTYFGKVWNNSPKGIKVKNNLFDSVDPNNITGIVSEIGIYPTNTFIEEMAYENIWKS